MKLKTMFGAGISAIMLLSFAGFAQANAAQSEPEYNADKGEWIAQSDWVIDSDCETDQPEIEWWTASEYENMISEQRTALESMIGTGSGWYDGQGVFHEWTQETVDAAMAQYEEILREIKSGILYSKPDENNDSCAQIPPNDEDITSTYSEVFVQSEDGK